MQIIRGIMNDWGEAVMKSRDSMSLIIKWIILIVVSVGIGTFMDKNILENMNINIWVARCGGALTCAIVALVLYYLFLKRDGTES